MLKWNIFLLWSYQMWNPFMFNKQMLIQMFYDLSITKKYENFILLSHLVESSTCPWRKTPFMFDFYARSFG